MFRQPVNVIYRIISIRMPPSIWMPPSNRMPPPFFYWNFSKYKKKIQTNAISILFYLFLLLFQYYCNMYSQIRDIEQIFPKYRLEGARYNLVNPVNTVGKFTGIQHWFGSCTKKFYAIDIGDIRGFAGMLDIKVALNSMY